WRMEDGSVNVLAASSLALAPRRKIGKSAGHQRDRVVDHPGGSEDGDDRQHDPPNPRRSASAREHRIANVARNDYRAPFTLEWDRRARIRAPSAAFVLVDRATAPDNRQSSGCKGSERIAPQRRDDAGD